MSLRGVVAVCLCLVLIFAGNVSTAESGGSRKILEQYIRLSEKKIEQIQKYLESNPVQSKPLLESNCEFHNFNQSNKVEDIEMQLKNLQELYNADALKLEESQNQSFARIVKLLDTNNRNKNCSLTNDENTPKTTKMHKSEDNVKTKICQELLQNAPELTISNVISTSGDAFYYFNTTWVNCIKARNWCEARGMTLAIFNSSNQVEEVSQKLFKCRWAKYGYWVNATDIGQIEAVELENIIDVIPKQPDPDKICSFLYTVNGQLSNFPHAKSNHILCEVPAPLHSCIVSTEPLQPQKTPL